ncbi:MAG: dihydrofolate reductase [Flavobacteriaceae bacterium]|nr:dihydrofolate reductase [Flavobacteriaceae bacterium]
MVSSLDGFIAKKDGSVSWLRSTDYYSKGKSLTAEEMEQFNASIDCYVMGSRTYQHALELGWPYGETPVVVLTHRKLSSDRKNIKFSAKDPTALVNDELKSKFKNIWMVGGSKLAKEFLRLDLADDIVIAFMPILLGDGLLFFDFIGKEQRLHLKDVTAYSDGMVELWYEIKN